MQACAATQLTGAVAAAVPQPPQALPLTNSEVTRTVRSTGAEQSTVKVELRAFCGGGMRAGGAALACVRWRFAMKLTPRAAMMEEGWEGYRHDATNAVSVQHR